jgi:hypothetical protein
MDDSSPESLADRRSCSHEQDRSPDASFDTNPFSTSRVRPGAIPFILAEGESLDCVIQRLRQHNGCGQIIGPHGSGKSTLLAALGPELERQELPPVLVKIQGGQRRMPLRLGADSRLGRPHAVLIVDGYEQLSWLCRWRVRRFCRRRRLGLIVTAHRDVGLPTLLTLWPDAAVVQSLVFQLLGSRTMPISASQIAAELARHRGNVRELLMDLYDRWEEESR